MLKWRPWLTSCVLSLIPTSLCTLVPFYTVPGGDFHVHTWTHQSTLLSSIHSTCIPWPAPYHPLTNPQVKGVHWWIIYLWEDKPRKEACAILISGFEAIWTEKFKFLIPRFQLEGGSDGCEWHIPLTYWTLHSTIRIGPEIVVQDRTTLTRFWGLYLFICHVH